MEYEFEVGDYVVCCSTGSFNHSILITSIEEGSFHAIGNNGEGYDFRFHKLNDRDSAPWTPKVGDTVYPIKVDNSPYEIPNHKGDLQTPEFLQKWIPRNLLNKKCKVTKIDKANKDQIYCIANDWWMSIENLAPWLPKEAAEKETEPVKKKPEPVVIVKPDSEPGEPMAMIGIKMPEGADARVFMNDLKESIATIEYNKDDNRYEIIDQKFLKPDIAGIQPVKDHPCDVWNITLEKYDESIFEGKA